MHIKLNGIFDVHVTVHGLKFLIIKPTRCTNFSNLFLEWNSACFGQFLCPSSGVFHCIHSNGIWVIQVCWHIPLQWNGNFEFHIIRNCIDYRHSRNSDRSSSWLAQLKFAVPYMAGLITRATLEIAPWKRINYLVDLPTKSVTRTILLDRIHAHS